jgi:hypothetical protein
MDPISIALGLANFVPAIMKFVGAGDGATSAVSKVIEIAKDVTGTASGADALSALKADPNKVLEFQAAMAANSTHLDEIYLADVQSARDRDVKLAQAGFSNRRGHILTGYAALLVVATLVAVLWASNIDDFVKATVTLVLGKALGWVDQIFGFEFGTTRASKAKDETIKSLTKDGV